MSYLFGKKKKQAAPAITAGGISANMHGKNLGRTKKTLFERRIL
jgi:hypothetical protein